MYLLTRRCSAIIQGNLICHMKKRFTEEEEKKNAFLCLIIAYVWLDNVWALTNLSDTFAVLCQDPWSSQGHHTAQRASRLDEVEEQENEHLPNCPLPRKQAGSRVVMWGHLGKTIWILLPDPPICPLSRRLETDLGEIVPKSRSNF